MTINLNNFDFKQKLMHHPEHLIALRDGLRPFPVTMEIDLTNLCNHNCYFCVVKNLREQYKVALDTDIIVNVISQLKELGTKGISFTGGGEPLLHKDFYKILECTHRQGFDTGLMTNGALITEGKAESLLRNLNWIRISVGAGNSELYKRIQGRDDYERVIKNVRLLGNIRGEKGYEVNLGVRMLLDKENYQSLITLSSDLAGSGINYIQVAPDCRDSNYAIFSQKDFKKILEESKKVLEQSGISLLMAGFVQNQEDKEYPLKCYAHYFQMAVIATGDLIFCKNGRDNTEMAIGNIYKNTIKEIWNGQRCIELESRLSPLNCHEICKNMQVNVAIENFLNPVNDMSINFIG